MRIRRTGRSCHHVRFGDVRQNQVLDVPDEQARLLLIRDPANWQETGEEASPPPPPPRREGLPTDPDPEANPLDKFAGVQRSRYPRGR